MDEITISTGFMQIIISNVICKVIRKKFGWNAKISFNEPIRLAFDGNDVKLHISMDAELTKSEFMSIINSIV